MSVHLCISMYSQLASEQDKLQELVLAQQILEEEEDEKRYRVRVLSISVTYHIDI